jgi:type VI secretion system protein ImpH
MPTAQRRPDPGVIERLRAEPYRFEFFQAVRVLIAHFRLDEHSAEDNRQDEDPVGERIRFNNSLSIGFAPSEIEALQLDYGSAGGQPVQWPDTATVPPVTQIREARLTPAFIGLSGNQGTLPRTYTEQLIEREIRHRDRGARAFLDIFNNRAVTLFYRAWEKYRLYFQYERNRQERFLPMVLSLVGAGNPSTQDTLCQLQRPVLAETLAYYAGALRHSARPAHLIERIVADYFDVPVKLKQFHGRWHHLPAEHLSMLGGNGMQLGVDTLCGERVWHIQTAFELQIGPLRREEFERFLPGGEASQAISQLLAMLAGITLECTVRPILRKEDVRPARLDALQGARLGHNTWVLTRMTHEHRSDVAYDITHEHTEALAA